MRKKINKSLIRRYLRINNTDLGTKINHACRDWWVQRVDLIYNTWTGEYSLPEFYSINNSAKYADHIIYLPVPYQERDWYEWWEEDTIQKCKEWVDNYVAKELNTRNN